MGVAHAGHGAKTEHRFLVHVKDWDEEKQCPEECGAVILARLGIFFLAPCPELCFAE